MNLTGKRILLIMPKYFGYEEQIENTIKFANGDVDVVYENIDEFNFFYRFIFVYMKKLKQRAILHYYISRMRKIRDNIDTVIVIRGSTITDNVMSLIRSKTVLSCKYIMYQWDSVKNNTNAINISGYFNKILTFDINDSKSFGWEYRPLFFINSYADRNQKKDLDIAYICSLHSKRVKIFNLLKKICENENLKLFSQIYSKKIIYYKRKYINHKNEYLETLNSDVSFKALSISETYNIYKRSKVLVDYTHSGQTGYTMRTIECLGNGCKLVTNNQNIKKASFYNTENFYVYDEEDFYIPHEFLCVPYKNMDENEYKYYSLDGWLESILE